MVRNPDPLSGREVIFEFRPVGNIMRVTAMDTASLTEITVQCPLGAGEAVFRHAGAARLVYMLKKNGILG